jgi:anti-sigma factor ChrR (cupin superfamily)
MNPQENGAACVERELLEEYALSALAPADGGRLAAHLEVCAHCAAELNSIRATVTAAIAGWPGEELRPAGSLWNELAKRIGKEGWAAAEDELPLSLQWPDIEWEQPAPGVYCKVLSIDPDLHRASLIVRLDPGAEYPPHTHAGVEELHLLDGELWIDDRKLYPGEFNRAERGTADKRVWSQTGCSCVLVTSTDDVLG